jgi:hypothetical protein
MKKVATSLLAFRMRGGDPRRSHGALNTGPLTSMVN